MNSDALVSALGGALRSSPRRPGRRRWTGLFPPSAAAGAAWCFIWQGGHAPAKRNRGRTGGGLARLLAVGDRDASIWIEIAAALCNLNALPHNKTVLEKEGLNPATAAEKKLKEIRSGMIGVPTREAFTGPKLFLRVVGPKNRTYGGEWWFEADLLDNIEGVFSRIYFKSTDRKAALREMLRELLAISKEWNEMTEVWALELAPSEMLVGYSGVGSPQKFFGSVPLTERGNRMLVGRARQIFFPVKNPLWVQIYSRLL